MRRCAIAYQQSSPEASQLDQASGAVARRSCVGRRFIFDMSRSSAVLTDFFQAVVIDVCPDRSNRSTGEEGTIFVHAYVVPGDRRLLWPISRIALDLHLREHMQGMIQRFIDSYRRIMNRRIEEATLLEASSH